MTMQNRRYEELDPWLQDFLEGLGDEQGLRANFFSRGSPRTQNESDFFQSSYQDWFDRYLGKLGGQARQGQDPNLSWTDFLDQNFDFGREFLRAPVERTGMQRNRLAGPARWLVNF